MTDRVNPYSPPNSADPHQSWWSRIKAIFKGRPFATRIEFSKGGSIICGGIAFFVDPYDEKTLYAGSPSTDRSDQRFALIAREALRYLPDLLSLHGESIPAVDHRRLVVRIVNDYSGIFSDYSRAVEVVPAPLISAIQTAPVIAGEKPSDVRESPS
ncbi:MAG: hypothetical protein AAFU85_25770 [Planctomycetota bacterium]